MDDKRLEPRAGPRVRPGRPIRFTPSHTEAIATPAYAPPVAPIVEPARSPLLWRVFVWLFVLAGWGVFAAWWVIVLQRETIRSFGFALGLLGATVVASAVGMSLWTRHNLRIARHGKRGMSSRYIPMVFERDTVGRTLELPADDLARRAPEIRVVLRGGVKAYVVPDAEEL